MYDPTLRLALRASLRMACDAMRIQQRAVDSTTQQFKHCARESKKTLATSYRSLERINRALRERRRA